MRALILCAATAASVVSAGCDAAGDRPGVVVLPGMAFAVPYEAYTTNPVTGQTLLLPPEGTVPYGASIFAYGPGKEEAARAGRELRNPLVHAPDGASDGQRADEADDRAREKRDAARGKALYDTFCLVCHGPGGDGDGPIIGSGRFPNPPSLLADHARDMPDGRLYHVIYHGQGLMPAYAVQVLDDDRWRVVEYVRRLQAPSAKTAPSPNAAPPVKTAPPVNGAPPANGAPPVNGAPPANGLPPASPVHDGDTP